MGEIRTIFSKKEKRFEENLKKFIDKNNISQSNFMKVAIFIALIEFENWFSEDIDRYGFEKAVKKIEKYFRKDGKYLKTIFGDANINFIISKNNEIEKEEKKGDE